MSSKKMSRREVLKGLGLAVAGTALAACAPKVVKETVIVEKPVEKVVKETVIVEGTPKVVEKVVTATPAPTEEVIELRYMNHWTAEGDAHYSAMQWVYKTFHERYPNIRINNVVLPRSDEAYKKIRSDCAAGDCPDIVHEVYLDDYDSGWILDMSPYVDEEWRSRLIPEVHEELTWEGVLIGVSLEYSPQDCIWNMRVLDKVGQTEVPKTWEEFIALGEALKSKGIPLCSFQGMIGLHGFTAILFGRPGAVEAIEKEQWDCEQVLYAFSRLKELFDKGFLPPNDAEIDWKQAGALWTSDQMAMYMNGAWGIRNEITAEGVDPDLRNHVEFSPFPSTGYGTTIQLMNATAIGLASHLKNQPKKLDAALTFLKFWTSDEAAEQFIVDAQSPMGVKAEIPKDKVPLLAAFMGAVDKADIVFSLPRSKKIRAKSWWHSVPGYTAILMGKSAEEATKIYAEEMPK